MARALPAELPGTVVAVTHDRYFLDNVAGWILELDRGRGIPFEGNYSSWLEQKQERLAQEEKQRVDARQRTLERELEWVRMAPKARQAKGKARLAAYEKLLRRGRGGRRRGAEQLEISIPPGPAPRRRRDRGRAPRRKGFGDRLLIDDLSFSLPPGRHRRRHRPERRRQDHAVPHDRRRSERARRRRRCAVGPTVELAYVDQSRDIARRRHAPSTRRSPTASDHRRSSAPGR